MTEILAQRNLVGGVGRKKSERNNAVSLFKMCANICKRWKSHEPVRSWSGKVGRGGYSDPSWNTCKRK